MAPDFQVVLVLLEQAHGRDGGFDFVRLFPELALQPRVFIPAGRHVGSNLEEALAWSMAMSILRAESLMFTPLLM